MRRQPLEVQMLSQAGQVLEVLFEDRPGDVSVAWEALRARGKAWSARVESSLDALGRQSTAAAEGLRALLASGAQGGAVPGESRSGR